HGLPRLRRASVPRVLRALLRQRLPRAARRLVGGAPACCHDDVPKLGPSPASAAVLRGTARQMTVVPSEIEVHSYLAESDERALADDVLHRLPRPFNALPL